MHASMQTTQLVQPFKYLNLFYYIYDFEMKLRSYLGIFQVEGHT